jgi:hypothetical protein
MLETSGRYQIQECFYNGWTHDHYVSSVFVFAPSVVIVACSINNPGCMHDSQIAEHQRKYLLFAVENVSLTLHLLGVDMNS